MAQAYTAPHLGGATDRALREQVTAHIDKQNRGRPTMNEPTRAREETGCDAVDRQARACETPTARLRWNIQVHPYE